ncbi:SDR family oxidoreductase [Curtobacterium pusillum]|uniref:SDR family oxidoreductase n=1 Tax=Curtobacterium pusillum TaxID=69373 RepID=UPI00380B0B54
MNDIDHARPVLVTGGSGFIAGHVILRLLAQGRRVRTTVRSLGRQDAVRAVLGDAGAEHLDLLEFVAADLTRDDGWDLAVDRVDGVLHVASPVRPGHVDDEDEVIEPARRGTLRVLGAARSAGVRRVVLTSAFHAAGFGHGRVDRVFTEEDWSPLDGPGMDAYGRSKVLAERAAWEFAGETGSPELVTILPVAVLGPVMGDAVSGTNHLLQRMLNGEMPGFPDLAIPFVDVRDVAAAHIAALDVPAAAGKRVLLSAQETATPLRDVGALLRSTFGERAEKVPTRNIPSLVVRTAAPFRPEFRDLVPELGYVKRLSTAREHELLGLSPRPWSEAVVAGARSMLDRGLAG